MLEEPGVGRPRRGRARPVEDGGRAPQGRRRGAAGEPSQGGQPPAGAASGAIPPRLNVFSRELLIGRAHELAAGEQLLDACERRESVVLTLEGEPGIGKTRLAAQISDSAEKRGFTVLYGRGDEHQALPFQPIAEALEGRIGDLGLDAPVMQSLGRIVCAPGVVGAPDVVTDAGAERYVLFGAVGAALQATALRAPLVVILDDLHWADEPIVAMLRHLIERSSDAPIGFVLAWRNTEIGDDHPLRELTADLARHPAALRRPLSGLSPGEIEHYVDQFMGALDDGARARIAALVGQQTSGNALFVRQLLRDMRDRAAANASIDDDDAPAPESVLAVVRNRVARLDPDVRAVLQAAAVARDVFGPRMLASCSGLDQDRVAAALEHGRDAGLLVAAGSHGCDYAFAHALVGAALYEAQSPARRGKAHRLIAEQLERMNVLEAPAVLAHHWARAVPADGSRALRWSLAAGEQALASLSPGEGARWFREALGIAGHERVDPALHRRALLGLGRAARDQGDASHRETLLEVARLAIEAGDDDQLIDAAIANTRGFVSRAGEVDHERIAILEAALRVVSPHDHRARAQLLAVLVSELSFDGDFERRAEVAGAALAAARHAGDPATLSRTLSARFVPLWAPETLAERLRDTEEAVELADMTSSVVLQFEAHHWRMAGLIEAGRVPEATRAAHREGELAERLGHPTARWMATYDRANLEVILGRIGRAEELAAAALEIGRASSQPDALPFYVSQLANVRYEQGRLGEMQELVAQIVAGHPGIPAFRPVLALACAEAGLLEEAAALLEEDAADAFARLPKDVTRMPALVIYAEVCARAGDRAASELLYDELSPWHDQVAFTGVGSWGNVGHVLGRLAARLGDPDCALAHYAEAAATLERIGAPVWRTRLLVDEAELRIVRDGGGDRETARELLEQARPAADRLGALGVEHRAEALAQRLRAIEVLGARRDSHAPAHTAIDVHGAAGPAAAARGAAHGDRVAELHFEGAVWRLRCDGREFRVVDGRGMRHLAQLLASPGVEIPAIVLVGGGETLARANAAAAAAAGLAGRDGGPNGAAPALDEQAKRAYRARVAELRAEIAEAESFNDPERAARAHDELDFVAHELAAAVGLRGRDRGAPSSSERARVNATRAIRKAIAHIGAVDADLARELGVAVRTGTFCCYDPPPHLRLCWKVDGPPAQAIVAIVPMRSV